jgi:catechol 2,3-dioxygenase-like lactoylglutathione lyase family enzyme
MRQHIGLTALIVRDYDEALAFYVGKLGFELKEDTHLDDNKRWVVVAPPGSIESGLLLAKAADAKQAEAIGNQSGGRVFLFLVTDDFERDHTRFVAHGVTFIREPRIEPYGKVAVFEDLYGNRWDLIERR